MRIIRVRHNDRAFYASIEADDTLTCLQPNLGYVGPLSMREVEILPLVAPSKIVCVGLNFRDHASELNMALPTEPAFFLKPPSSLLSNGQTILLPQGVGRVDYEAELAVIVGQPCRNVPPDRAADYVFGYSCANDVTARDLQKEERMFGRCKGFDTFCPLGPWIETGAPPQDAMIRTIINGEVRQEGSLADMIVPPLELVSAISRVMSLMPGDVILTGTPKGVGAIQPGDAVRIEVEKVGVLFNNVARDELELAGQGGMDSDIRDGIAEDAVPYRLQ